MLLTGATGTGKELIAQLIHEKGRPGKMFAPANCGGMSDDLVRSELFGHIKGSFTDAVKDKAGAVQRAYDGTLFLDEVGDASMKVQTNLLRFLNDGTFERVGESGKNIQAKNVRVIAATNRDLPSLIREGKFREDLFYRLSVYPIHLDPLTPDKNEKYKLLLLELGVMAKKGRMGKDYKGSHDYPETVKRVRNELQGLDGESPFTKEAKKRLLDYTYPGNRRELRNIVTYMLRMANDGVIGVEHLHPYISSRIAPTSKTLVDIPPEFFFEAINQAFMAKYHEVRAANKMSEVSRKFKLPRYRLETIVRNGGLVKAEKVGLS